MAISYPYIIHTIQYYKISIYKSQIVNKKPFKLFLIVMKNKVINIENYKIVRHPINNHIYNSNRIINEIN